MRTNLQLFRIAANRLPAPSSRRLVVLTGARQTGKTTLARTNYPELRYLNLDSLEEREALRELRTAAWGRTVGAAVLDEAQKEPAVFEKVKWGVRRRRGLLHDLITRPGLIDARLCEEAPVLSGEEEDRRRDSVEHLLAWGGMPGLLPL